MWAFNVLSGCQTPGCWTEKANLRHHKCARGHWSDCENLQEHCKVEVSFNPALCI